MKNSNFEHEPQQLHYGVVAPTHSQKTTKVTIEMNSESNQLLTLSAKRSKRTKRAEAELRLRDHLKRFKGITAEGEVTE